MSDFTMPKGSFEIYKQPELALTICGNSDKSLVTIHPDGQLEYGSDYTPDNAADAFWRAVSHHGPHAENARLRAENEKLREALRIFVWTADELFADERYQKLLKAADKIMESGE